VRQAVFHHRTANGKAGREGVKDLTFNKFQRVASLLRVWVQQVPHF